MNQHARTAITGGTGFVGRHLAERLGPEASVIISRRTGVDTGDVDALTRAFKGARSSRTARASADRRTTSRSVPPKS